MVSRRTVIRFLTAAGVISILSLYPTYIETNNITIMKLKLDLGLNLRIVHISDTHFASSLFNPNIVVDCIESLNPDVIFHTGDLITYMNGLNEAIDFMRRLSEIAEVFIVAGNHDHWSGLGSEGLKRRLKVFNHIHVLNNEALKYRGIWIIGVDDPYTDHDDISKALANVRGDGFKILLAHSPQIIGKANGKVDLILAGHTHGGQVRIPFYGPLWVPLPKKYKKYVYGLFQFERTVMFVTRGIGTSFFPIRFNCPPEICLWII